MSSFASKLIGPMGFTILVCFFLPWLTVSCGNMTIINDASGFEMAQGITIQGQQSESAPVLYIIAAAGLVMGLAGLVLWASHNPAASVVGLISALAVLVVWFLFRGRVTDEFALAAQQGMVFDLSWEMGFWGIFIGGAVGGLSSLLSFGKRDL